MSSLSIHLLGPPRLERDGESVHLARRRTLAFAIYLAMTGEPHHRERLTTLFWPASEASHARASLRRAIYQVNQALGDGWLTHEGKTLRFRDNDSLWLDVKQFRQRLAACQRHDHADETICPHCLSLRAEAVNLYHNDFLAGFSLPDSPEFDDWQFFQSEALRDELASALERLIQGHAALDQYEQAIAYARRWLVLDVLHEPAHRWLMQLHAWHGQQAAALRQYEQCAALLDRELGIPPAPETEQLYQAIRARRLAPLLSRSVDDAGARATAPEDDIRIVTVMSVGLADDGSDDSAAKLDALAEATQALLTIVEEACAPYAGLVEHITGDACLVLFGADQGHEDDAERAVRAAAAIQQMTLARGLSVHIGVDTGMAYCRRLHTAKTSVLGAVVNLATRLRNRAAPGQILTGRNTYLAASGICDYEEGSLALPGFAKPLRIYAVQRLRSRQVKQRGLTGLQSRLVGRDDEMVALRGALKRLRAREGGLVTIVGEAGVGKSRLVYELRADFTADAPAADTPAVLWLEGRALAFAAEIGYWLFADLLRGHLGETDRHALASRLQGALADLSQRGHLSGAEAGEIGPFLGRLLAVHFDPEWDRRLAQVPPEQMRRRTDAALRSFLFALAQVQPLVLVFEDLHWADPLSVDLIASLLHNLGRHPLLLFCLYRPQGSHRLQGLTDAAQRLNSHRLVELYPARLTLYQSRILVASLLADAPMPGVTFDLILTRAEGNPLFIEEIVRGLVDAGALTRDRGGWRWHGNGRSMDVPLTLQSLVLDRVDGLTIGQRQLLQAAAVFGRVFRPRLLASSLADASALDEAMTSLTEQGFVYLERERPEPEYSFQHVLVQEAIYQGLPLDKRAVLHCRIADELVRTFAEQLDPFVEQLARHYELGGQQEQAVTYLLWSGRKAQQLYQTDTALTHYRHALSLCLAVDEAKDNRLRKLEALRGIGEAWAAQGNLTEANVALRQAMALAAELDLPPTDQVRLYFPLCQLLRWLGRLEELFALGQEGLALLGDDAESAEAVMLITFLATGRYLTGERRQYRALTGRVVEALRRQDYGAHLVNAYGIASWWYRDKKQTDEAMSWIKELEDEAERRNDLWTLGHLRGSPGYWLPEAIGDVQSIQANINSALAIAEKTGDPVLHGYALTYMGHLSWLLGDLERAEAMYTDALTINSRNQAMHLCVLDRAGIGWVLLSLGDRPAAIAVLERALADAESIRYRVHGVQMARLALAQAYAMSGRRDEAAELCKRVAIEYEVDSDGLAWIASALAGLERVLNDPAAFCIACRYIVESRHADDPLPVVQWQLKPAQRDNRFDRPASVLAMPDFSSPTWRWIDPYGDCAYAIDSRGLAICATNYYRDLWFNNVSAPRLLRQMQGDFAIEARCATADTDRPALGGLALWSDDDNFLRLDWNVDGTGSVSLRGAIHGQDRLLGRGLLPIDSHVTLRLERVGSGVRALCSTDGMDWYAVAEAQLSVADSPVQVGPLAIGMIHRYVHPGAWPEGSAIRFTSLRLLAAAQAEAAHPLNKENST